VPTVPTQDPDRLTFGNLDTGETLEVQFNPTELAEKLAVTYQRLGIVGMSHEPMQYSNTANFSVEFTLFFDRISPYKSGGVYDLDAARKFLLAFGYSRRGALSVAGGAPPSVLVMWPNLYTLTCKMTALDGKGTTFAPDGSLLRWNCKVSLEEFRDFRLWGDDVAVQGTQRPATGPVDASSTAANGG
jgi:Contractile injection system tube protein